MWPDRVSNPEPLTYKSGALSTALRGPASKVILKQICQECRTPINRHFEEARLLVAFFIMNFNILCSFL